MLSIIIPTLDEEKYLPILLSQIKKQSFSDYEIIVADGGSTDKTVEIAKSFDCKVTNGGLPAKGRNEGAKIARGEIFLFLDSDNIYLPEKFLEKLIFEFEKRNLGVASFPIYPAGNWFDKIAYFFYNSWTKISQNFLPHATNSVLVKKEVFEKIGGFNEEIKIGEDHDFARRAAKISKFGFIETEPVLTSIRRFEKDGRIKTYLKYLVAGIYMLFFGPIKKEIFKYRFDDLGKNDKIKNMKIIEGQKFELKTPLLKAPKMRFWKSKVFIISLIILVSFVFGLIGGFFSASYYLPKINEFLGKFHLQLLSPQAIEKEKIIEKTPDYTPQTSQEEATIKVVNEVSPAVVSIIITKDLPVFEEYYVSPFEEFFGQPFFEFKIPQYEQKGTQKQEIGGGTGFIVSEDGMILTNGHVVSDKDADYTVLTNDGKKYPAKVLARDSIRDLAVIKIEGEKIVDNQGKLILKPFPTVKLGDSDKLQIGQTVIAIGNALGEFRNTVSVGVISGLGRTVTASGGGMIETLEDVIQTDAAINKGNSGGPLLNLKGEVIGVNFAMAQQAESIGFTIPINKAKKDIEQVKTSGKIVYPFLGVRYALINEEIQKENNLPVDYGVWVQKGTGGEAAIFPGSPAEKVGLKEGDIILEFNGEKITTENSLAKIIMKYNPGDKVSLKILKEGQEKIVEVILEERSE